mgnify:FL=1
MKKKRLYKTIKFFKHPIKNYKNCIKQTIIPKPYSHRIIMPITIKKGEQSGTALIPCTIYAMDHSIDLNPALIRKKDRKLLKYFKPNKKYKYIADEEIKGYHTDGKKVFYNPNDCILELTEDEKEKGYFLSELERCKKCGQKLVMAEVKATRYRSCPLVQVKLGDKAKEDITIPVEFGVNKSSITRWYWIGPIFLYCLTYISLDMFFDMPFNIVFSLAIPHHFTGFQYFLQGKFI